MDNFLLVGLRIMVHFCRTTNAVELLQSLQSHTYATVHTENLPFYDSCQWQFLEYAVNDIEIAVAHLRLLIDLRVALVSETHLLVDGHVFMGASQ